MPLDQIVAALTRAGFDVTPTILCDALWLATQAGFTIDVVPVAIGPDSATLPGIAPQPLADRFEPGTEPQTDRAPHRATSPEQTSAYQEAGELTDDIVNASPVRVPAGAALPGRLALLRSMRPFTERWPSRRVEELDEEATVSATAEQAGRLSIVFRRRPERWFDAAVVVDESPSMDVWHDTLIEFERLLLETGAFRDVRTWRFGFGLSSDGAGARLGRSHFVAELKSPTGGRVSAVGLASRRTRRLVFLATHGISPRWLDGSMGRLLDTWAHEASIVILHMLPPELWAKTALGEPGGLTYALTPGARTAELGFERFTWEALDDEPPAVPIPVIPLERTASLTWARMQMARGRRSPAMLVPTEAPAACLAMDDDLVTTDRELVTLFRSHGSSEAFRLAVYLSAGPFTLPVARLIQAAKLGSSASQTQLAEVFLSGLVRRNTPLAAQIHPDWVQYEIRESARELLLRSLTEEDAQSVLDTLQAHVGRFIEQTYGKPADFRALIRDPQGTATLPAWAQPFAAIGTALIRLQNERAESDADVVPEAASGLEVALDERARLEASEDVSTSASMYVTTLLHAFGELPRTDVPWLTGLRILWCTRSGGKSDVEKEELRSLGAAVESVTGFYVTEESFTSTRCDILIGDIQSQGASRLVEALIRHAERSTVPVIVYARNLPVRERNRFTAWGAFGGAGNIRELLTLASELAEQARRRRFLAYYNSTLSSSTELQHLREGSLDGLPQEVAKAAAAVTSSVTTRFMAFAKLVNAITQASSVDIYASNGSGLEMVAYSASNTDSSSPTTSPNSITMLAADALQPRWIPDLSRADVGMVGSQLVIPATTVAGRANFIVDIRDVRINAYSSTQIRWLIELVRAYPFDDDHATVPSDPLRVLVAGTGKYELSQQELWASEAIGRMLAEEGHHLVTGGWRGIDHVLARAYVARLEARGLEVNAHLTQVVAQGRAADFDRGTIVRVSDVEEEFDEELRRADIVILIGGAGGTYEMFRRAQRWKVPVLPLPTTGGDALRAFEELTKNAGDSNPLAGYLHRVALEIQTSFEAQSLAQQIRRLLVEFGLAGGVRARTPDEQPASEGSAPTISINKLQRASRLPREVPPRWRPSAQAKRLGPLAVRLEEMLERDGWTFDEAYEMLNTNYGLRVTRDELERLAERLPRRATRRFESDDALAAVAAWDRAPDELVKQSDRQELMARVSGAIRTVMSGLEREDQLILRLRFGDGRTVTEIASVLRLGQKDLYRRVEKLLKKLRDGLEAEGIDAAAAREILENPEITLDWPPP